MARGKPIDPQTREAVMAALLAGMGVSEVATKYRIDKSTASRIKARLQPLPTDERARADLSDLLVDCVREILTTVAAQSVFARSEKWLEKQTAAELATLQGSTLDRALRILAALEPGVDQSTDSSGVGT